MLVELSAKEQPATPGRTTPTSAKARRRAPPAARVSPNIAPTPMHSCGPLSGRRRFRRPATPRGLRGPRGPSRLLGLLALLGLLVGAAGVQAAAAFPSTGAAWVLPGGWQAPTDRATLRGLPDAAAVREWEIEHADVSFGGDYGTEGNARIDTISYMYNQKLDFSQGALEQWLRRRAGSGEAYEDDFLHFAEDTVLAVANPSHASRTPFGRRPWVVGWTADASHGGYWLYQEPPWDAGAWDRSGEGGALYVLLAQPFDELTIELSRGAADGTLGIDYPSAVDANGLVTAWSPLSFSDGTANLAHDGVLRWVPPADWQWAALHDGSGLSYGHGQFFGQPVLQAGGRSHVLRLSWTGGVEPPPRLANVLLRDWMPQATPGDPAARIVPGWDPANDADGSGFVDDAEWAARPNPSASARQRWESRVTPLGHMWNESSNWCVANLFRPALRAELAAWFAETWAAAGIRGGYNDDLFRTVGPSSFEPLSGGAIAESPHRVGSEALFAAYGAQLLATLSEIARATASPWVTANVSAVNLFTDATRHATLQAVSGLLREGYLHAAEGLTGYFGLTKAWDVFAAARRGVRGMIQVQAAHGRARTLRNSAKSWDYDRETMLAEYYLLNVPGLTYLHAWDHSFQYGSGNTQPWVYYRAGVPKNVAYQPTALLRHDIGAPTGAVPGGFEPMRYMVRTSSGGDYTLVGDSTDEELVHPELLPDGRVPVVASGIFYLQRAADHPAVPGVPLEAVVARAYTKGLVAYRTDVFGANPAFTAAQPIRVALPRAYRRLRRNGRGLAGCSSTVRLGGYEGAILVADPHCP